MTGWRRFAVYYAPRPETALGRFGVAWLGWDPERGAEVAPPALRGLPRPWEEIVAAPRRYGFHATLKAPFRLAAGADPAGLDAAAAALAADRVAFAVPVGLAALGPFLALTPRRPEPALAEIERACVQGLDGFRAPLTAAEIARRAPERLTPREAAHLADWGYPYVLDEFRFHLTLTGPLPPAEQRAVRDALAPALAPAVAEPLAFEDLCLFAEAADGRFHVVSRHALRRPDPAPEGRSAAPGQDPRAVTTSRGT